jgi:F-type H+-transporting ATPase subunit c
MKSVSNYIRFALAGLLLPLSAFAEEGAAGAHSGAAAWVAAAVGFGIALAVVAATTAQGRIASSYMEGASRNPGASDVMKTPLILGLAFVESLVLFAVLIAFMLLGKM